MPNITPFSAIIATAVTVLVLLAAADALIVRWNRRRLVRKIEKAHGTRLFMLLYREERLTVCGIPVHRYPDMNDTGDLVRAIEALPCETKVGLIVNVPSGVRLDTEGLSRAVAKRREYFTVYVPEVARSGAVAVACAASRIVAGPHAVFTALDPIVGGHPASVLRRLKEEKGADGIGDDIALLVHQADRLHDRLRHDLNAMFEAVPAEQRAPLVDALTDGRWPAEAPVPFDELRDAGFPVVFDLPADIAALMTFYEQPLAAPAFIRNGSDLS